MTDKPKAPTRGKTKHKALTDTTIKSAKAKEKDYKLVDGEGLFLLVSKSGGKRWRFKYRFQNKEKVGNPALAKKIVTLLKGKDSCIEIHTNQQPVVFNYYNKDYKHQMRYGGYDVVSFFVNLNHSCKDGRYFIIGPWTNKFLYWNKFLALEKDEKIKRIAYKGAEYIYYIPPGLNYRNSLADLVIIRGALFKYRFKYGHYPKSKGFDGLHTKWGQAKKEWIKGLVPEFLDSSPLDERNTTDPFKQYLYKSDGKDYKLISGSPVDCELVKKKSNHLIDPVRDCNAYGYWTKGAEQW